MQKLEALMDVPLFQHQKNKIILNDTGIKTAEYAKKIISLEEEMVQQIRLFDKNKRLITFGSCAPIPKTDFTEFCENYTQIKLLRQN